jgi:hypothetical protein
MISKRIVDSEYGFFKPVFSLVKQYEAEASTGNRVVPKAST